jgi:hypothetical protein
VDRLLIAAVIVAVAVAVAVVVRRRRRPDAPSQVSRSVPSQLDRADFEHPDAEWLVAVFTSATCASCAGVLAAARSLAGGDVAVVEVEYQAQKPLHERYRVDAVPMLVIADADGVVRASVFGPAVAAELAQELAAARASR